MNAVDCGLVWAPPYRVEITDALRPGANQIEIVVHNTAANALAADEPIRRLAAESEARYGRRFRLQDLDQAMATVRSGLARRAGVSTMSQAAWLASAPRRPTEDASESQASARKAQASSCPAASKTWPPGVEGPLVPRRTGMPTQQLGVRLLHPGPREQLVLVSVLDQEPRPPHPGQVRPVGQ